MNQDLDFFYLLSTVKDVIRNNFFSLLVRKGVKYLDYHFIYFTIKITRVCLDGLLLLCKQKIDSFAVCV